MFWREDICPFFPRRLASNPVLLLYINLFFLSNSECLVPGVHYRSSALKPKGLGGL